MQNHSVEPEEEVVAPVGILGKWHATPLYWRIAGAMILGIITGLVLGDRTAHLSYVSQIVLRILGALAPPLIFVAIVHALMTADIKGKIAGRMVGLLLLNTLVAIVIGLAVANVIGPGRHTKIDIPHKVEKSKKPDLVEQMIENVPKSLLGPMTDEGKVIGVIFLALSFGMAFRQLTPVQKTRVEAGLDILMASLITILHWVIDIVPFAVFAIVANIIGTKGFAAFHAIGLFVISVLVALALQALWYLLRIRFWSWVKPTDLVRSLGDAYAMAFSTGSSTITMPLTYSRLKERVGLRERSASMGALVGSNFNNDGTALYEAMSALFVAQLSGLHLNFPQQLMVVITSVVASVGAAGIPEAGLVTMTLVFHAVGLPPEYIAILLTVDWFLDRCRTVINVMGDCNVSCLLDGKMRETAAEGMPGI